MKILITGAAGFVGKNLTASLENIRDGKDRVHKIKGLDKPSDLRIYTYDIDSAPEELDTYCRDADFVFNLAGVNRPKDPEEFMKGNFGFGSKLLNMGRASWRGKNFSGNTAERQERRCLFTASRTCSENGADRIIIQRWQRSAIILPTIFLLL